MLRSLHRRDSPPLPIIPTHGYAAGLSPLQLPHPPTPAAPPHFCKCCSSLRLCSEQTPAQNSASGRACLTAPYESVPSSSFLSHFPPLFVLLPPHYLTDPVYFIILSVICSTSRMQPERAEPVSALFSSVFPLPRTVLDVPTGTINAG